MEVSFVVARDLMPDEVPVVADRGQGAPARGAVAPLPARHPAHSTGPWVRRPHPRADPHDRAL